MGVLGSGNTADERRCREVGEWLARDGYHLLTGGGGGVMEAVSRAFSGVSERRGLVLGVLPADDADPRGRPRPGYPNPWVEVAVMTHLPLSGERGTEPLSRNHINVLTSQALIALPGGEGTASEVRLALLYGRPLVAYLEERSEIPRLPPEVQVVSDLAGVQSLVRGWLR